MATTTVSVRMDKKLKQDFEHFCDDVGMNMTTAFNIFATETVRENRIPFEIRGERASKETAEALREVKEMGKHPERYKGYADVNQMMKEILNET